MSEGRKYEKKVILFIVLMMVSVGILSGCFEEEVLTLANIILKNITYNPNNPKENETIIFTVFLENTGDESDSCVIKLLGIDSDMYNFTRYSDLFKINGHSQKNILVDTNKYMINEGMQTFEIEIIGKHTNYTYKTLQTIDINIQPASP